MNRSDDYLSNEIILLSNSLILSWIDQMVLMRYHRPYFELQSYSEGLKFDISFIDMIAIIHQIAIVRILDFIEACLSWIDFSFAIELLQIHCPISFHPWYCYWLLHSCLSRSLHLVRYSYWYSFPFPFRLVNPFPYLQHSYLYWILDSSSFITS